MLDLHKGCSVFFRFFQTFFFLTLHFPRSGPKSSGFPHNFTQNHHFPLFFPVQTDFFWASQNPEAKKMFGPDRTKTTLKGWDVHLVLQQKLRICFFFVQNTKKTVSTLNIASRLPIEYCGQCWFLLSVKDHCPHWQLVVKKSCRIKQIHMLRERMRLTFAAEDIRYELDGGLGPVV